MSFQPPKIFIADDDLDIVNILTMQCRRQGWDVESATDASSAWKRIERCQPDAVVLDIDMPCGDGFCVCEMMSKHGQLCKTPVVMLTGRSDNDTIKRCHELIAYYVPKDGDLWPKLQPLLEEMLETNNALESNESEEEMFLEPVSLATTPDGNKCERIDSAHPETILMDAVFAALGVEEHGEAKALPAQEPVDAEPAWVLSIDDDAELSYGIKLRLREHDVEVVRAFSGTEGIREAFMTPARAILLDYEMPEGNGDYVLERLKSNPITRDIPVVVLTGRKDKWLERKMYGLGAHTFLNKPYDWSTLWQVLEPMVHNQPVALS